MKRLPIFAMVAVMAALLMRAYAMWNLMAFLGATAVIPASVGTLCVLSVSNSFQ